MFVAFNFLIYFELVWYLMHYHPIIIILKILSLIKWLGIYIFQIVSTIEPRVFYQIMFM
jgi:hypothetical protein